MILAKKRTADGRKTSAAKKNETSKTKTRRCCDYEMLGRGRQMLDSKCHQARLRDDRYRHFS